MPSFLELLLAGLLGYLLGSIPFGVVLARLFGWPDPRSYGSGHTGGLNVSRSAGRGAMVLVGILDLLKGLGAILLVQMLFESPWVAPIGGMAAVAGHNWPAWLGFNGGMGLATSAGAVGSHMPLVVVLALVVLLALRFTVVRHSPRATIGSMASVPLWMIILGAEPHVFWLAAGAALIVMLRYTIDWNREYEAGAEGILR